jgi:hypothetical protein
MNLPNQAPTAQDVAQEAEFQLMAAKDLLEWQHAIINAVHLDHLHGGGQGAATLVEVAKHFSDTGFGGVYSAIDQFRAHGESAPQNARSEIVARNSEVHP